MVASVVGQRSWRREAIDYTAYGIVRILVCVLQACRMESCVKIATLLAWLCNDLLRIRYHVIDENLRHAFPAWSTVKRRQISRQMWRHFLIMLCEIAQAPRKIHQSNWRDFVSLAGRDDFVRLMLDPRPVVAVTAHFGNFEMSGYMAGLLGFPTFTVARPLDNPYLHRFLASFRESTGQYLLPTQGSAMQAQTVIESGHTLAILGDHFGGVKGCWVPFFGRPASCHKSVALFAIANKCPLMVVTTHRDRGPMTFQVSLVDLFDPAEHGEAVTVPELTEWYTQRLEQVIVQHPDQYWWMHRRWKDPRPAKTTNRARPTATSFREFPRLRRFDPAADPEERSSPSTRNGHSGLP